MNTYKKDMLTHPEFYIAKFIKNPDMPYLLFIHGGPGFNCGIIEYFIENMNFFNRLDCNIILYDQRNCGKSKKFLSNVIHQDNVDDLHLIIQHLHSLNLMIHCLIGHSYGAKLLFDYYEKFHSTVPGIFISTANSILTPRLNNLILDLAYLKKSYPLKYNTIYNKIEKLDLPKIWTITEELAPLFQENKDRTYFYWANMECFEIFKEAQKKIDLPIDNNTFLNVRKDLYSNELNFKVTIDNLTIPYLWINGFHDFIMNGSNNLFCSNSKITTFFKSSHYPHLEENDHFCELVNEFVNNS